VKIGFSYIRFSSEKQSKGDSLERQTETARKWCENNDVHLDNTLPPLHDQGKSAFRGKHRENPDKYALAMFLKLVETDRDRVPRGSYLIVESLDRLTREDAQDALRLVLNLTAAGIKIVQLQPSEIVYDDKSDAIAIMQMVLELMRGNSESQMKSVRLTSAMRKKKDAARESNAPMGVGCPAWLELCDGKYRVKEDAAKIVRDIFKRYTNGDSVFGIAKRLNAEVLPISRRPKRDGKPHKRAGKEWTTSYISKILSDRSVLAEYQPHKKQYDPDTRRTRRVPDGEPIVGYYGEPVITVAEFAAAQAALKSRASRVGRPVESGPPILFSGLLRDAKNQCPLYATKRGRQRAKHLVSARALNGSVGVVAFPVAAFEDAVLSQLRELDSSELFTETTELAELEERMRDVEKRLASAGARWEADPESKHWGDRVSRYDREQRSLAKELAEARQRAATPASASWGDIRSTDPLRLRAALLRTIDTILCVAVAPQTTFRLLACQIRFKNSEQQRSYLIHYVPRNAGGNRDIDAKWRCWSLDAIRSGFDFRDADDVAALADLLATLTPAQLDRLSRR
jgi:DNA invertase Pin-like site-specific DNA recombinase